MVTIVLHNKDIFGAEKVMVKFMKNGNFNEDSRIYFKPAEWRVSRRDTLYKSKQRITTSIVLD